MKPALTVSVPFPLLASIRGHNLLPSGRTFRTQSRKVLGVFRSHKWMVLGVGTVGSVRCTRGNSAGELTVAHSRQGSASAEGSSMEIRLSAEMGSCFFGIRFGCALIASVRNKMGVRTICGGTSAAALCRGTISAIDLMRSLGLLRMPFVLRRSAGSARLLG